MDPKPLYQVIFVSLRHDEHKFKVNKVKQPGLTSVKLHGILYVNDRQRCIRLGTFDCNHGAEK